MSVVPYKKYGLVTQAKWSFSGADGAAILKAGGWEEYQWAHAWFDNEAGSVTLPEIKSSYKLPHHKIVDGKLVTHWPGVAFAMAALLGSRGGIKIPEVDKKGVYNHLSRHYDEFKKTAPTLEKKYTAEEFVLFHADQGIEQYEIEAMREYLDLPPSPIVYDGKSQKAETVVVNEPNKYGFGEITGEKVLKAGTYQGFEWTHEKMDEAVANYEMMKEQVHPVVKIGHGKDQAILKRSGYPAAGWFTKLWRDGDFLLANFDYVPGQVMDLVSKKAYRSKSIEFFWNFHNDEGLNIGPLLTGVAFLGEDMPQVSTLGDIQGLYQSKNLVQMAATYEDSNDERQVIEYQETDGGNSMTVKAKKPNQGQPEKFEDNLETDSIEEGNEEGAAPETLTAPVPPAAKPEDDDPKEGKFEAKMKPITPGSVEGVLSHMSRAMSSVFQMLQNTPLDPEQAKKLKDHMAGAVSDVMGMLEKKSENPAMITAEAEFQKKQVAYEKRIADLEAKSQRQEEENLFSKIEAQVDSLCKKGKMLPAQRDAAVQTIFAAHKAATTQMVTFSKTDKPVSLPDAILGMFSSLNDEAIVSYSEESQSISVAEADNKKALVDSIVNANPKVFSRTAAVQK